MKLSTLPQTSSSAIDVVLSEFFKVHLKEIGGQKTLFSLNFSEIASQLCDRHTTASVTDGRWRRPD